jgi:phospholipid transport system substrate-binding protein
MKNSKSPWAGLVKFLLVLGVSVASYGPVCSNALAAPSPLELIRSTTDQAMKVLTNSSAELSRQQQIEEMWQVVLPRFDTKKFAQGALGSNWQKLTEEQKKEFVALFVELVKSNYTNTLKLYTQDAKFYFDQEHIEGDYAEVQTRILPSSQNSPLSVVYHLYRAGDVWLIYDVIVENVSLVQNYRNQFSRIMAKSSGAELLDILKNKIAELKKT